MNKHSKKTDVKKAKGTTVRRKNIEVGDLEVKKDEAKQVKGGPNRRPFEVS